MTSCTKGITSPTADKQCLMFAKVSAARGRSPLAKTSSTLALNWVSPAASCFEMKIKIRHITPPSGTIISIQNIPSLAKMVTYWFKKSESSTNIYLQCFVCCFHSLFNCVNFSKSCYRFSWGTFCLQLKWTKVQIIHNYAFKFYNLTNYWLLIFCGSPRKRR